MDLLTQGEAVIRLQKRSREWVKRRIEVVRFLDGVTIERETTLDLELSRELLDKFPTLHGRKLLPLKLLKRDHDVNVTIRDAEGVPLSQLNRKAERNLVAAGLVYQYYELKGLAEPPEGLVEEFFSTILREVDSDPKNPSDNLSSGPVTWEAIRKYYMDYRFVFAVVDVQPYVDGKSGGAILRLVMSYPDLLPSPYNGSSDSSLSGPPWFRDYFRTVDDWIVGFDIMQVEACESFHFEVIAPSGICVPHGTLKIETESRTLKLPDTDPYPDRAHFFHAIPEEWTGDEVVKASRAELVLRPMHEGWARPLYRTSMISGCVLSIFFLSVGLAEAGLRFPKFIAGLRLPNFIYGYDTQSIVTLLLLGPTLLTGLMIRDNEHTVTKLILRKLRCRVAIGGIATLVSSIAFALGWAGGLLFMILFVCLFIAWAMVLVNRSSPLLYRHSSSNLGKDQCPAGGRHRGGRHRVRRQRGGLANRAEPQQN